MEMGRKLMGRKLYEKIEKEMERVPFHGINLVWSEKGKYKEISITKIVNRMETKWEISLSHLNTVCQIKSVSEVLEFLKEQIKKHFAILDTF